MVPVRAKSILASAERAVDPTLLQQDAVVFLDDLDLIALADVEIPAQLGGQDDAAEIIDLA